MFNQHSDDPVERVAAAINKNRKRRAEMLDRKIDPASIQAAKARDAINNFEAPEGWSAPEGWRLVGVLTPAQDAEFMREANLQGEADYLDDDEFFTKRFPQLSTLKPWDK